MDNLDKIIFHILEEYNIDTNILKLYDDPKRFKT